MTAADVMRLKLATARAEWRAKGTSEATIAEFSEVHYALIAFVEMLESLEVEEMRNAETKA